MKKMRWIYKTVHYELKKEGILGSAFLDESEIEESLNEFGKAGWELVSTMEISDGIMAILKQPFRVAGRMVRGKTGVRKKGNDRNEMSMIDEGLQVLGVSKGKDRDENDSEEIGVIRIE